MIVAERIGGVLLAKLANRIDATNAGEFERELSKVIGDGRRSVILDFEDLGYISFAGLRAIQMAAADIQARNRRLAVCSLSESIGWVFELSGFDKIIPIFETRSEAIATLSG